MLQKLNEILSLFTPERPEMSPLDIAELLGRPKSTVYRLLSQIEAAEFLDRDDLTGRYRLGVRLSALGQLAQKSTSLQRCAFPVLQRLSEDTQETATLMILKGTEGLTVDVVESYQPLMTSGLLGGHLPLHATAGGKALLAWRSRDECRQLLQLPLTRYTPNTITDLDALMRELDEARRRGYTVTNGEWVSEIIGVAAPVRNHSGWVVGALTAGGPRSRMNGEKLGRIADAIMLAAERVSRACGYSPAWLPRTDVAAPVRQAELVG